MKFKISVGEFESAEEPQIGPPQISDDVLQKYVEAVGDITTPTGTFHREKKLVFERFLEKAKIMLNPMVEVWKASRTICGDFLNTRCQQSFMLIQKMTSARVFGAMFFPNIETMPSQ